MAKSLTSNSLILLSSQFVTYAIQFLIIARLLLVLNLNTYGIVAFSQAFVLISVMILDFGFSISATNKISKYRNKKKYVGKLILSILIIKITLFFFLSVLLATFLNYNNSYVNYNKILLISLPTIFVLCITPVWFFYGIERLFYYSLYLVMGKFFLFIMVYLIIDSNESYIYFPVLSFVSQAFILVYFVFYLYRENYLSYLTFDKKFIFYTIRFTRSFIVSRLALSFNSSGGILILGTVVSPAIVGVYSIADQIYRVLQTCVGSLSSPLYSYTSNINDTKLVFRIVTILMLFLTVLCFILLIIKTPILSMIQFEESSVLNDLLGCFIIIFWINSFGTIMGYPLYAALGRLSVVNWSQIISAYFYIFLLFLYYIFEVSNVKFFAYALIFVESYIILHRVLYYIRNYYGKLHYFRSN
jgi:PST family polysaccharide transporter